MRNDKKFKFFIWYKSDLYGIIGSAVSCGIIILLLFLILMPRIEKPEEEGIVVSFGDVFIAGGQNPVTDVTTPQQPTTEPTPTEQITPPQQEVQEDMLTQVDESLAIARQEEERRRREQEEVERRRREEERQAEQRRQEEERQAEARRQEEERRRQEAADRASALGNVFGTGQNDGGGMDAGEGQQGNPVGRGTSEGNSWSLDGRSLVGSLVRPTHDRNVEGTITVVITVDTNGNVTDARIGTPTTIGDEATRRAAVDAARRTRFTAGRSAASGTITYNFRLR